MKVLFLASYFPKPANPVMGTWALSQAQALAAQPDVELLVVSFTSQVPAFLARSEGSKAYADCPLEHEWEGGVKVLYPRWLYYPINPVKRWMYSNPMPYLAIAKLSAQKKLTHIIDKFQPDVYFCHHSLPNGWLIANLPTAYQKPLFVLDHDYNEISDCRIFPSRYQAFSKVANKATALMAVSKRMEQDLKSLFPNANVFTHHNGITLPNPKIISQARPKELQHKKIIVSCALFAERKGIPLLIEAFAKVTPQHPNALLRIIGSGPDEDKIENTIKQHKMESRVQLLGRKNHDDVLQEIAWSDFFALVGWDEPFATVYLESMAVGKAIICCDDGGINDVVENGIQALTVPPRDTDATAIALDKMLASPQKCHQMGGAAKSLINSSLTWHIKAEKLVKYFSAALQKEKIH
ncbi:MAG: glycosyltransferase family 4 protein [Limnothrix sp.]